MKNKTPSSRKMAWEPIIAFAEAKLQRTRLKVTQLEALIATFYDAAKRGEPPPSEVVSDRR